MADPLDAFPCHAVPSPCWSVPSCAIPLPFLGWPYRALPQHLRSCPVFAVPCPFSPRRICEAPFHNSSCRFVVPRRHSLSTHRRSVPFVASRIRFDSARLVCHRRHAAAHPRLSWRCHFVPCLSDSRQLIAVMCPAVAVPIKSLPHCAVPFLFFAPGFAAIPLRCRSDQSLARQFSAFSSLFWSLPCHFVSTHLRFCRSWPFLCCSLPVRAEPCPFLSIPLGSIPFRVRSDPCASAGLVSNSARSGSCPSFSLSPPCQSGRIGSPQRRLISCLLGSIPYPVRSGSVPASQSPVHATQTKPG